MASFCDRIESLDLFGEQPQTSVSRRYRIWTYESAALDLACRQAGRPLHDVLGREPRPLRFVVSLRLGSTRLAGAAASAARALPGLEFKLDPTPDWDDRSSPSWRRRAPSRASTSKASTTARSSTPRRPGALRARPTGLPDAWIEDPHTGSAEVDAVLAPHRDRVSWDAPIHSVADILDRPWPPKLVNVKPSRLGSLRDLLAAYEHCEQHGIRMYGGGQFELGPGAAKSSTSRRCSTPTAQTTSPPAATTTPPCRRSARTARSILVRARLAFAGNDATEQPVSRRATRSQTLLAM